MLDFQALHLKGPHELRMYANPPTHYGSHHRGNSWKGASHIQEVGKVSGYRVNARQTSRSQAVALFPL